MKILSPAGNFESLKLAVYNGADEVYLGINNFNARNNIDGFTKDTLEQAVDFAHVYGVKVNLAINILFNDDEIQDALNTIIDAYNMGVDAFIIQDLGLASIISKNYPQIEIHASTQMGIHNLEGVKAIEKFGFKRVVLARETPLDEIKRIRENSDIEIEYFAQGALCVSFSGNCYLSSYLCNASGNRGKCKQLCRLPYTMEFNGKKIKKGYLLSAKDFNTIDRLNELKNAGVDVLKIEGRARRPVYIALATREYFNAIHGQNVQKDNLKLAFNREYTAGYFDGNGKIISDYHNHIGVKVGKVEKVNRGKKFNEVIFSSNRELSPKSTFKLLKNREEKNTITAFDLNKIGTGKYKLTTTQNVGIGDDVHLILDSNLEESVLDYKRKRNLKIKIIAEVGKKIYARFSVKENTIEVSGQVLEESKNQALKEDDLVANFKKSEIFDAELEIVKLENVFVPNKVLNEFRRNVFDEAFSAYTKGFKHSLTAIELETKLKIESFTDFEIVERYDQKFKFKNIIYTPESYELEDIKRFQTICKNQDKVPILDLPNFALKADIDKLKYILDETKIMVVVNNYYGFDVAKEYVIGAGMNVYNSISANELGAKFITAEGNLGERIDYPYMTLRHCPMKTHLNVSCDKCPYKEGYVYKMENGKILKLKRKKLSTCTFYLV